MFEAFVQILHIVNLFLNGALLTFLFCQTNLDDSTESGNFPVRACLPLIQKDSTTNMHGLTVYVKEGLPFIGDLSLENSADPYVFNCLYFNQCLTFFLPIDHLLCLYDRFLIPFHLTQMRFCRSNHLPMCLCLEDLTSIIRTGSPVLVELIDLVNSGK